VADTCERCRRPLAECTADKWGDAKAILECRETELQNVRSELSAARALNDRTRLALIGLRDNVDWAIGATVQEVDGG
jgi:hypothetical protein